MSLDMRLARFFPAAFPLPVSAALAVAARRTGAALREWMRDWGGALTLAAVVWAVAYDALLLAGLSEHATMLLTDVGYVPFSLAAAALSWRAARQPTLDHATSRAWSFLALAHLCYSMGNLIWCYYEVGLGIEPSVSWADAWFLLFYPLVLWGLLSFPAVLRSSTDRLKFWIDTLTVTLSGGMGIWFFVLRGVALGGERGALDTFLAIAYPLGDMVLLFGTTALLLRRTLGSTRWSLGFLAAGVVLFFVADLAYGHMSFLREGYVSGSWPDLLWPLGVLLMVVSAHLQHRSASRAEPLLEHSEAAAHPSRLPFVALVVAYGLLLGTSLDEASPALHGLVVGAVLLTVLVVVRQVLAVRENVRLLAAQVAAREGEARLRSLVAHASDLITTLEPDGTIRFASPSIERILGYAPDAVIGSKLMALVHPDDEARVVAFLQDAIGLPGVTSPAEWRLRCRDGSWLHVENVGTNLLPGPSARGLVLNTRDVTDRRRIEEALRRSEERYRLVSRATKDVVYDWHIASDAVTWNDGIATVLGYSAHDVRPQLGWWDANIHPDDRARVLATLEAAIAGGSASWTGEYRFRRRDGSYAQVQDGGYIVRDDSGEAVRMIGSMQDITSRKQLEEQLRQSQKMDAVGRLAGGIAHDFNNLLTVIKCHSELLLEELAQASSQHEEVRDIQKAAERATALTRQLLAFSRKQLLQPRVIDLNAVVGEVEPMLRRLIGEDIGIATMLDPALGRTMSDPSQLEQLLVNLAVNARDAMPGGGTLTIETANIDLDDQHELRHAVAQPGPYVMLVVGDDGCGMDADTRARAFEPFFTTKPAGQGTGLGLSTVYGIVQQSGGYISVQSEPGRGTTFRIYLPRVAAAAAPAPAMPAPAGSTRGSETILLVEDEDAVRALAKRILERQGYRVFEARHGADALRVAEQLDGRIDLVLTDVVMPHMNGRELAERLAAIRPGGAVLFMSGYTDDEIIRRGLLDPEMAFLQKPFTANALARAVRDMLDGRPAVKLAS
jgi:PAS domain S-box-containing protein